ncbi:MAG: cyclomaltodextrinase [Anaerolineales bacterium]|nr:cyclomaltodextrinase [Anaerolineales bacterium]
MDFKWLKKGSIYHIYPLGALGCPRENDFSSPATPRILEIIGWLDHISSMGVSTIYLGPLFESTSHGYDTADYYWVDRRLGTNQDLKRLSEEIHNREMHLILDGVFNHVGRNFWAFRDLQANGQASEYRDWFSGVDFTRQSPLGDTFAYDGWQGHFNLVKLNLQNPKVSGHLLDAVKFWVEEFNIDGLRLDAADDVWDGFWKQMRKTTDHTKENFWLMGEVIHKDYRQWVHPEMLHSTTNYVAYKGLWSSLNDGNLFEIAYTLREQFQKNGQYSGMYLYNFVDNHDVSRAASILKNKDQLPLLYGMMYSIPGIPSLYYGSEYGWEGKKTEHSDENVRLKFDLPRMQAKEPFTGLCTTIQHLSDVRMNSKALVHGDYSELFVQSYQFGFKRSFENENVIILINAADDSVEISMELPQFQGRWWSDLLQPDFGIKQTEGQLVITVPPIWLRILKTVD